MDIAPLVAGVLQWPGPSVCVCVFLWFCAVMYAEKREERRERENKWRPPDEARFSCSFAGVVIGEMAGGSGDAKWLGVKFGSVPSEKG